MWKIKNRLADINTLIIILLLHIAKVPLFSDSWFLIAIGANISYAILSTLGEKYGELDIFQRKN